MIGSKRQEQKAVEKTHSLIDSLQLNYAAVVIHDLQTGECHLNDQLVSKAALSFSQLGLEFNLFKSPRGEDDAIIFLIRSTPYKLCLKMLPDVWIATAEHLRRPNFLETMSNSRYLPNVYFSKIDINDKSISYLYKYVEGVPLSQFMVKATMVQKTEILKSLNKCINELVLEYQLDINFGNLDDFVIDPTDMSYITLIDLNTVFQASSLIPPEDLLRIVKRRALKMLSKSGFNRDHIFSALCLI